MRYVSSYMWLLPFLSFIIGYHAINFYAHPRILKTPNLIGNNTEQALTLLAKDNLALRLLALKEDAELPAGTIISQNPKPESKIKQHQSIFVVVSKKPSPITMPQFLNKTSDEITTIMAGLPAEVKRIQIPADFPQGICIGQYPEANASLLGKETIKVYMACENNKPSLMPNLQGRHVGEIIDMLMHHHCSPEIIHTRVMPEGHSCVSCIVTDQRPLPGSIIKTSENNKLQVQLKVMTT